MIHSIKRISWTCIIALLLCLHSFALSGQTPAPDREDKIRLERLVTLGKLWVTVKYFHPWLAYKDIDWDAAFFDAFPKTQAAKTEEDYAASVRAMLAVLDDTCTHLASPMPGGTVISSTPPSVQMREDGILVVTFGDPRQSGLLQQTMTQVKAEIAKTKAIVLDLRGNPSAAYALRSTPLIAKPSVAASIRQRLYSGYPAPDGTGSGGYYSGFLVAEGKRSPGAPDAPDKPLILLIDQATRLNPELIGLQTAGFAAIVAEGGMSEESILPQMSVKLADGLAALVRTGELIYPDGTGGLVANKTVSSGGLEAAIEMARAGVFTPPERKSIPATGNLAPDKPYPENPYPSEAHRALAAFRIWSVFSYFHPYKHLTGENWDDLLLQFLPKMMKAQNALEYHKTVAQMVAHAYDTHCFVNSLVLLRDLYGAATPPLSVRWIEESAVITKVVESEETKTARLAPGDIVLKMDGRDVKDRMNELAPYIAASTPQALMWRTMNALMNGPEGSTATLTVKDGGGQIRDVTLPRSTRFGTALNSPEGEPFRLINENIGYVNLSLLRPDSVDEMFEKFRNTRGFIMDMRGYPRGTAWQIAPRLSERDQPVAAQFRRNIVMPDTSNFQINISSQIFEQRIPPSSEEHYSGRTVMLIDERAISQAEHSGLFYRTASGTKFIGSPTNGANGDVTWFTAPGGIRIMFTGHDVRHADGTQLQRVGLQPDIPVRPTIAGIRAGRDEVLEKAIEYLMNDR